MTKDQTLSFSKSLKRLEEIVDKLETVDLDLEESLKLLEEGVKLHKICRDQLQTASSKVKTILKESDG